MKWFLILLTFPLSSFSCDLDLRVEKKSYKVCSDKKRIYSVECKSVSDCFKTPESLKYYPNQSPLFSLCYQSGGAPHFAKLKDVKNKVEVCVRDEGKITDLGSLMELYKKKSI